MFDSTADLKAKVKYYLTHEDERRRIVAAARALVLERHTWEKRAAFITHVVQDTMMRYQQSQRFHPASPSRLADRSRLMGCYTSARRPMNVSGDAYWHKQKRVIPRVPYGHGFNISDCESSCEGSPFFGLRWGGFSRGDAHMRADCLCGGSRAFQELAPPLDACRCHSTCSLRDERPCGWSSGMAVYRAVRRKWRQSAA
mmetsp:Transcript_24923/g.56820  ORF Transcript_24923/g.56820 Transcript_24923/m.56820 type:complete len:199 (-) Transcript_24923:37-633(-)